MQRLSEKFHLYNGKENKLITQGADTGEHLKVKEPWVWDLGAARGCYWGSATQNLVREASKGGTSLWPFAL